VQKISLTCLYPCLENSSILMQQPQTKLKPNKTHNSSSVKWNIKKSSGAEASLIPFPIVWKVFKFLRAYFPLLRTYGNFESYLFQIIALHLHWHFGIGLHWLVPSFNFQEIGEPSGFTLVASNWPGKVFIP
jgi:hypothetical protein